MHISKIINYVLSIIPWSLIDAGYRAVVMKGQSAQFCFLWLERCHPLQFLIVSFFHVGLLQFEVSGKDGDGHHAEVTQADTGWHTHAHKRTHANLGRISLSRLNHPTLAVWPRWIVWSNMRAGDAAKEY